MTELELAGLPPRVAEGLGMILQVANGDGARRSSSWEQLQADSRVQNLDRNERLALAAALMEYGQALVNQASSDLFEAGMSYREAQPGEEGQQAIEAAHAAADRAREESVYYFEAAARIVRRRSYEEDDGLDREVSQRASELADRLECDLEPRWWNLSESRPFRLDVETVVAGFVALKVLGPFAEAFAKKLGELLAERADKAIDRIHLIKKDGKPQVIRIKTLTGTIVIVLPEDFRARTRSWASLSLTRSPCRARPPCTGTPMGQAGRPSRLQGRRDNSGLHRTAEGFSATRASPRRRTWSRSRGRRSPARLFDLGLRL